MPYLQKRTVGSISYLLARGNPTNIRFADIKDALRTANLLIIFLSSNVDIQGSLNSLWHF